MKGNVVTGESKAERENCESTAKSEVVSFAMVPQSGKRGAPSSEPLRYVKRPPHSNFPLVLSISFFKPNCH